MPLFEVAFAEVAPELFAEEAATTLGAEALGTTLGAEALAGLGAEALGGASAVAPGITQATMAADAAAGGAGAGAAGVNAAQVGAQQAAAQQVANAGIQAIPEAMTPAQQAYQAASTASVNPGIVPGTQPLPAYNYDFSSVDKLMQPNGGAPLDFGPPVAAPAAAPELTAQQVSDMIAKEQAASAASPLESGFDKAMNWADKNPFKAMMGATLGAQALGLFRPSGATFNQEKYNGPLSKYYLSPNFQGRVANPANYQYKGYAAGGGIMGASPTAGITPTMGDNPMMNNNIQVGSGSSIPGYASGGSLADSIASYQKMLSGHPVEAPAASRDVGIYYDQDPDTRYQDALTAAQIRQAKVNQRAYVSPPVAKRPTPMGQLQMASVKAKKQSGGDDVEAAQGGIMHSSLGGYAAGGNPRLLKGPGDGMSDNIPATINGRQPARLADGEFVIPADVVSHLGNGSTEAGAKQLHSMMDKVRKARTGNPKQGKEINPKKYMPK